MGSVQNWPTTRVIPYLAIGTGRFDLDSQSTSTGIRSRRIGSVHGWIVGHGWIMDRVICCLHILLVLCESYWKHHVTTTVATLQDEIWNVLR